MPPGGSASDGCPSWYKKADDGKLITRRVRSDSETHSCVVRDLAFPGELTSQEVYPFEFGNVELQYESYRGLQVKLRSAHPLDLLWLLYF